MPRMPSRHDAVLLALLAAMLATTAPLAQTGSNTMYKPYQMLGGWAGPCCRTVSAGAP